MRLNDAETIVIDDEDGALDTRRLTVRVVASLVFAVFAYLGFMVGGDAVFGPSARANLFSSSGRDTQPPHLTTRDVLRGVLAADRKAPAKSTWHDAGSATLIHVPALQAIAPYGSSVAVARAVVPQGHALDGYYCRGPPITAA